MEPPKKTINYNKNKQQQITATDLANNNFLRRNKQTQPRRRAVDAPSERRRDKDILLFLFALLLFVSPFTDWWAQATLPWFFPFALWGMLILLIFIATVTRTRRED